VFQAESHFFFGIFEFRKPRLDGSSGQISHLKSAIENPREIVLVGCLSFEGRALLSPKARNQILVGEVLEFLAVLEKRSRSPRTRRTAPWPGGWARRFSRSFGGGGSGLFGASGSGSTFFGSGSSGLCFSMATGPGSDGFFGSGSGPLSRR